jgi:hypothetical protein
VPPPQLLQRIECGEVGGVILFTGNVPPAGAAGIRCTVARLQRAANAGGNPLLLIATDQEGGNVRRMLGVPRRSPRELEPARRRRRARPVSRPVAPCARWGIAVNLGPGGRHPDRRVELPRHARVRSVDAAQHPVRGRVHQPFCSVPAWRRRRSTTSDSARRADAAPVSRR